MICERAEVLASACAIARAFPIYNEKCGRSDQEVDVGFIVVDKDATPLGEEEVKCLNALCEGVRLAAEIVDMPTNHMHTDAFLDVSILYVKRETLQHSM